MLFGVGVRFGARVAKRRIDEIDQHTMVKRGGDFAGVGFPRSFI